MDEIRWVEIAPVPSTERFSTLSRMMAEIGLPNSYEYLNLTMQDPPIELYDVKGRFSQIRLGGRHGIELPKFLQQSPMIQLSIQSADCILNKGGIWTARSLLYEALQMRLASDCPSLDLDGGVLVAGNGAAARASIAALVKTGFDNFTITARDDDNIEEWIADLRRRFFKIEFCFRPQRILTQLGGTHSVMINAIAGGEDNELHRELCFFNFLKSGGVVIDLQISKEPTLLVQEARQVGALPIEGIDVATTCDELWVQECFARPLDRSKYREELRKSLTA